jgi:hypothetical protein
MGAASGEERAMAATLKTMSTGIGYTECCRCHERITDGAYCYREQSRWWHVECPTVSAPATVASPAPVAAPAFTPEQARYVAEHLADHYSEPERPCRSERDADAEYNREG